MRFVGLTAIVAGLAFFVAPDAGAQSAPADYGVASLPALADPRNSIVLIYNHGSITDRQIDPCDMKQVNGANGGVPYIVNELHGTAISGKMVFVDGYCSQQVGDFDSSTRTGEPKVLKRAKSIEARAQAFTAAGVPPVQIFLVGQSAGGWASLLVKAGNPAAANAVIAFAPAFAGRWRGRNETWQWLRDGQVRTLSQAGRIPALVFSIHNDEYELPEHLSFMDRIPGLERVVMSDLKVADVACDSKTSSHQLYRNVCFYTTQGPRLKAYIEKRLAAAD